MARSRWQFSLASLMLLVTLVCISLSLCNTSAELRLAQQRLRANRYESIFFKETEPDPSKLHGAVMLASCRVHVPEGHNYILHIRGHILDKGESANNFSNYGYTHGLSPGLHSIFVETNDFEGDDGVPSFIIRGSAKYLNEWKYNISLKGEKDPWLAVKNRRRAGPGLQYFSAKPGEPLELFRMRLMETVEEKQPDGTVVKYQRTPNGLANDILIWVDDDPNSKTVKPVALPVTNSGAGSKSGSRASQ